MTSGSYFVNLTQVMEDISKKAYEISYLLKAEEDASLVIQALSDLGAEIVNESAVSEIRLSYPINKETKAYFAYLHFNLDPELVVKLRDALQLNTKVLRFLIVTPPFVKSQPRREVSEFRAKPVEFPHIELSNDALEERLEEIKTV